MKQYLAFMLVASTLLEISCTKQKPNMLIDVKAEDGFVDLTIPITLAKETRSEWLIEGKGTLNGSTAGFRVHVPKGHDAKWLDDGETRSPEFFDLTLESLGLPSDTFVQQLAKLYGATEPYTRMKAHVSTQAVVLHGDTSALKAGQLKIKLFLGNNDDTEGQLYLNIDLRQKRIEFNEKDSDYRRNVLVALAEHQ